MSTQLCIEEMKRFITSMWAFNFLLKRYISSSAMAERLHARRMFQVGNFKAVGHFEAKF